MNLAEYLVSKGITQADAARQLKVSPVAIHQYIYGKALPSGFMMLRIYKWSNKQITTSDWYKNFPDKRKEGEMLNENKIRK